MNSAIVRTCERVGAVLGVVAVAGCVATNQTVGTTLGVALGAVIALANLILIRKLVGRALSAATDGDGQRRGGLAWMLFIMAKLGILLTVIWAAVAYGGASPLSIMVGVSAVFASVIVVSLFMGGSSSDPDLEPGEREGTSPVPPSV